MSRATPRPIEDFESVFRALGSVNDPVILVGGHAVNLWALSYKDRLGDALPRYEPLMSGDLDLFTTVDALRKLHEKLGGEMYVSPPREITTGLLVLGVEPNTLEVDILRSVNGIPNPTVKDVVALDVCGSKIDVPFPQILLQAKLANSLQLAQDGRQDVKHAKVASLVTGAFVRESITTADAGNERFVLGLVQEAVKIATSDHARQFAQRHGHECLSDIPLDAIARSPLPRLVNFTEHQLPRILAAYRGTGLAEEKERLAALRNSPTSHTVSNERNADEHPAEHPAAHPGTASPARRADRPDLGSGTGELAAVHEGPRSQGESDDRGDVPGGRAGEEADRLKRSLLFSAERAERMFRTFREHVEIDVFGFRERRGFMSLPENVQTQLSEAAARYGNARQFFDALQSAVAHAQEDPARFAAALKIEPRENAVPLPDGVKALVIEWQEFRDVLIQVDDPAGALESGSYSPERLLVDGYAMPPGLEQMAAGIYTLRGGQAVPENEQTVTKPQEQMPQDHVGDFARCSADTRTLREEKERLYAKGFPILESQAVVAKYYDPTKFEHLRGASNLFYIVAPSTTGENVLPYIMAQNLRRDFGGQLIPGWATPQALTRSALKSGIEKLREPPAYQVNKDVVAMLPADATVVLVDDVVTTGGSVQGMREALAQEGVRVSHVTSLAQSELRLVRDADIDRITDKLMGTRGRDDFAKSSGFASFQDLAAQDPDTIDDAKSGYNAWLVAERASLRADVALSLDGRLKHLANYIETSIRKTDATRNTEISAHFRTEAQRLRELGQTHAGAILGIDQRVRDLESAQSAQRPGPGLDTGVSREGGAVRASGLDPQGRDGAPALPNASVTDRAAAVDEHAREESSTLRESLAKLDALRIEYADNPDKHVLAEARGIAEALGGPDVTRIPLASAASEYVKGNVSRSDIEILAGKNERAASHSHDKPEDRSQGNDLGR